MFGICLGCLGWDGMFGLWLRGERDTIGLEGRFVVPCGRVNKLVSVMRFACARSSLTRCEKESCA